MNHVLVSIVVAALGWALFVRSVVVLNHMTPATRRRWLKGPAWVMVGVFGFYLGIKPAISAEVKLDEQEAAACAAGGGCVIVTRAQLREMAAPKASDCWRRS